VFRGEKMKKYRLIEEASGGSVRFYVEERCKKYIFFNSFKRVGWTCGSELDARLELDRLLMCDVDEKRREEERKSHPEYKRTIEV
jgi:hypothetical protein